MMDPTDVCRYGHQLAPGSTPIRIREADESGRTTKDETLLLRRHAIETNPLVPHGHFWSWPRKGESQSPESADCAQCAAVASAARGPAFIEVKRPVQDAAD